MLSFEFDLSVLKDGDDGDFKTWYLCRYFKENSILSGILLGEGGGKGVQLCSLEGGEERKYPIHFNYIYANFLC